MHHSETTHKAITARAHALWEAEGRPEGKSIAHWLQAEAEVTKQAVQKTDNKTKAAQKSTPRTQAGTNSKSATSKSVGKSPASSSSRPKK